MCRFESQPEVEDLQRPLIQRKTRSFDQSLCTCTPETFIATIFAAGLCIAANSTISDRKHMGKATVIEELHS